MRKHLAISLFCLFYQVTCGLEVTQDVYHVTAKPGEPATLSCAPKSGFPDKCTFVR